LFFKTNPRVVGGGGTGRELGRGLASELLLFAFGATAASLELFEEVEIAAPVIVGGLLAAEEALEGVAGLGVLVEGGADGVFGFGVGGGAHIDDFVLDAVVAVTQPVGADCLLEDGAFDGSDGLVAVVVFGGEAIEFGGIFAWDDHGLGVDAELQGVAAGGGTAFCGARSVRERAVSTAGCCLCRSSHDFTYSAGACG